MASEPSPPAEPVANLFASALIYGVAVFLLRLLSGGGALDADALWEYRMGALLATPGQALLGALIALPLLRAPTSRVARGLVSLLGAALLAIQAGSTLGWDQSRAVVVWALCFLPVAFFWMGPLSQRLSPRLRDEGGRRADLLSLVMVATFSFATLLAAEGPLWEGAAGPLARLLSGGSSGGDSTAASIGVPSASTDAPEGDSVGVPSDVRAMVLGLQGIEPFELADARYPYCRAEQRAVRPTRARSVILLMLADVADRELELEVESGPLMPQLRRIAAAGESFETFLAVGGSPSAAVGSTFASIPPLAQGNALETLPPPRFSGFPAALARAGWATAFARGDDLSLGHRRAFARSVGFETLLEPDPRHGEGLPTNGDAYGLNRLAAWVDARHEDAAEQPVFVALESVGAKEGDGWEAHLDRVARLDGALGHFYDWYVENEAPRGTVLLIAGSNHYAIDAPDAPSAEAAGGVAFRFGVPLLVLGRETSEGGANAEAFARPGSHLDLGATVMGLVGAELSGCGLGLDLLAPVDPEWPLDRVVVSVAGPHGRFLYLRRGPYRWMNDRSLGTTTIFDVVRDSAFERDLYADDDPELEVMGTFRRAYQAVDAYLVREDAFAPSAESASRPPRAPSERVTQISRGASVPLPEGQTGPPPSSFPAIEAAVAAGYEWVEVEVDVTTDGVVFVGPREGVIPATQGLRVGAVPISITLHDLSSLQLARLDAPFLPLGEILARVGSRAGLILTLPPWRRDASWSGRVAAVARAVSSAPASARLMVRAADVEALATLETFGGRPTIYEHTGMRTNDAALDYLAGLGFDVIDVKVRTYSTDLVERVRARGMQILVEDPPGSPRSAPDYVLSDAPPLPTAE